MMFQLLPIVALLGALSPTSAHLGEGGHLVQDIVQDYDPHFYCGRNLAKILAALCGRDDSHADKRSYGEKELMNNNMILNPYKERNSMPWPWISRHRAAALEAKSRGRRMGVATECCDKPCNIDELLSYC